MLSTTRTTAFRSGVSRIQFKRLIVISPYSLSCEDCGWVRLLYKESRRIDEPAETMPRLAILVILVFIVGIICGGCTWYVKSPLATFTNWDYLLEEVIYSRMASMIAVERMRLLMVSHYVGTAQDALGMDYEASIEIEKMQLSAKCGLDRNSFFVKRLKLYPAARSEAIKSNHNESSHAKLPNQLSDSNSPHAPSAARFQLEKLTTYFFTAIDLKSVSSDVDSMGDTLLPVWRVEVGDMSFQSSVNCPVDSIDVTGLESIYKVRMKLKPLKDGLEKKSWVGCIRDFGHLTDTAYICDSSFVIGCP